MEVFRENAVKMSSMTDGENSMAGVYITQVPSPGALGLLAAGLPMLLWRRRRAR